MPPPLPCWLVSWALRAHRRALTFKVGRSSGTSGTVSCFSNEESEVQRVGKVATTPLERYPTARLDLEALGWEIYWRRGCSPVENMASTQNPNLWNRAWMLLTAAWLRQHRELCNLDVPHGLQWVSPPWWQRTGYDSLESLSESGNHACALYVLATATFLKDLNVSQDCSPEDHCEVK